MTKDKYEAAAEVLQKYAYNIDDLAKLMCRVFAVSVANTGETKGKISKTIYGEGLKFRLSISMEENTDNG